MDQDLRPRVFISSVMGAAFAPYRDAAFRAIERAGCQAVRAEDHPASMIAPHTACLDMVASCDGSVTILGPRYGNVTETGYSATEDEYREAVRLRKRVYLFVEKTDTPFEPRQEEFVRSVTQYVGGNWRKSFSTPDQLEALVEAALREDRDLGAGQQGQGSGGAGTGGGAQQRIEATLQQRPATTAGVTWLQIVWAPLRDEDVIRPTEFGKDEFQDSMMHLAHTGKPPLFTYKAGKDVEARSARLRIQQESGGGRSSMDAVLLDIYPSGLLSVTINVTRLVDRGDGLAGFGMYYIDPDDVQTRLSQAWGFAARFWGHIDEFSRYNALLYNAALYDIGHSKWGKAPAGRTSFSFPSIDAPDPLPVFERPRRIARADLLEPSGEIGEMLEMLQMRFTEMGRV